MMHKKLVPIPAVRKMSSQPEMNVEATKNVMSRKPLSTPRKSFLKAYKLIQSFQKNISTVLIPPDQLINDDDQLSSLSVRDKIAYYDRRSKQQGRGTSLDNNKPEKIDINSDIPFPKIKDTISNLLNKKNTPRIKVHSRSVPQSDFKINIPIESSDSNDFDEYQPINVKERIKIFETGSIRSDLTDSNVKPINIHFIKNTKKQDNQKIQTDDLLHSSDVVNFDLSVDLQRMASTPKIADPQLSNMKINMSLWLRKLYTEYIDTTIEGTKTYITGSQDNQQKSMMMSTSTLEFEYDFDNWSPPSTSSKYHKNQESDESEGGSIKRKLIDFDDNEQDNAIKRAKITKPSGVKQKSRKSNDYSRTKKSYAKLTYGIQTSSSSSEKVDNDKKQQLKSSKENTIDTFIRNDTKLQNILKTACHQFDKFLSYGDISHLVKIVTLTEEISEYDIDQLNPEDYEQFLNFITAYSDLCLMICVLHDNYIMNLFNPDNGDLIQV